MNRISKRLNKALKKQFENGSKIDTITLETQPIKSIIRLKYDDGLLITLELSNKVTDTELDDLLEYFKNFM